MRQLIYALIFLFIIFSKLTYGQQYGNEWIDFSRSYFKVQVYKEGMYKIPYQLLVDNGIPTGTVTGANFQLFFMGEEVPIFVTTSGILSSGDYIEFYGRKNDGQFDQLLYPDSSWQPNTFNSLFNDTAIYYITWNGLSTNERYTNVTNDISSPPVKEDFYIHTSRLVLSGELCNGRPYNTVADDVYSSQYEEGKGWVGISFATPSSAYDDFKSYNLTTNHIYASGPPASIKTTVIANSNDNHRLQIDVESTNYIDVTKSGYGIQRFDFNVPLTGLQEPQTNFLYTAVPVTDAYNRNNVSYLQIDYPRTFDFNNAISWSFEINNTSTTYLEITNFNEQGTTPILYDRANNIRIEGITQAGVLKYVLPPVADTRRLFLTNQNVSVFEEIDELEAITFIDYSSVSNQGDFILLSDERFLDDGNSNNYIADYANYRNSQGSDVITVMINQLYDQFAYGIRKHPISITNFSHFAIDNWATIPQHLFIVGKGLEINYLSSNYSSCIIPTFGIPGSDNLLTADIGSFVPQIATGRLSVESVADIKIYLDKVEEFESNQSLPQTISDKLWMKQAIHLGGGKNESEQNTFKNYLNNYGNTFKNIAYGGTVNSFYKTSSDPIQISESEQITSLIRNGASLMTFFGHGSTGSFDYSVDNPENFNNKGKYPLIFSNACFTGAIHVPFDNISEDFVLIKDEGAIGFLSASSFSTVSALNTFANNFYKVLSQPSTYGLSIGNTINQAIDDISSTSSNIYSRFTCEQMNLHGDPALKLNTHTQPDYVIEANQVSFSPSIIYTSNENFDIEMNIYNLGQAISDSIYIDIVREFPNGEEAPVAHQLIAAPSYNTIETFTIDMEALSAVGLNKFKITIDAENDVDEISETNNYIEISTFIQSNKLVPIYPYDFSIVTDPDITLKASTATTIIQLKQYQFEIDTTENFNSPLKQSTAISQIGGVLKWQPNINFTDSTVYYWRVSLDSNNGGSYDWSNSSFIYISNSSKGWNQSHYYQYLDNNYINIELSDDRVFKFVDDLREVRVVNGFAGWLGGSISNEGAQFYLNGNKLHNWKCTPYSGWYIAVLDERTGIPLESPPGGTGVYNDLNCKGYNFQIFRFDGSLASQNGMAQLIDDAPDGSYILSYSLHWANPESWNDTLYSAFESLGATQIRTLPNETVYILFAQKGNSGFPITEAVGGSPGDITDAIDTTMSFFSDWGEGYFESPQIGPSAGWESLKWHSHSIDTINVDIASIDVIGISSTGIESELINNIQSFDTSLSFIDANTYPYIKLRYNAYDDSLKTPPQLDYWRVLYNEVPELALNPNIEYEFIDDTLAQGETLKSTIAIENVSEIDMDSLLVNYSILKNNGSVESITYPRQAPLLANEAISSTIEQSTISFSGNNILFIEANPDNDQPEKNHFNNIAYIPFHIIGDNEHPLLDVTFDGIHILDGDIISAKPEILITLKDENQYLALDDTNLINVFIQSPKGELNKVAFDNDIMTFYPASLESGKTKVKNKATIEYTPNYKEDGTYKMIVQGSDKSGNQSGEFDYTISFEIINKPSITNVLNYPNPFTTSTRFVFTLTGSEIPIYFKIQVMTVTGKVIREISLNELGPINIGRNITQFAWNGTDQYGDPVGNGLYLYRVVTSLDGETQMEKRETSADKYFKSGLGKMYLMR